MEEEPYLKDAGQFEFVEDWHEDIGRDWDDETVRQPDHPVQRPERRDLGRRSE